MKITELKKSLPVLMRNNIVPFIWGQQGIGKTQTIQQIAKEEGLDFVHLHLATQEVGDLVGLLIPNPDGTVHHARPDWFPISGKGIIFLDELNRAHPDVLQACFSLITGKTIHTHKLPDTWHIVAAGNYQSNQFNVTDTSDAAWMSRFCHIDLQPSKEEFVLFTENNGNDTVAEFIRQHSECLEVPHKERLNTAMITPDRRSWDSMIGRLEKEEDIDKDVRYELYSGIVGSTAASAFIVFKKKFEKKLSGKKIIKSYSGVKQQVFEMMQGTETRFDQLNSAVEEIMTLLPTMILSQVEMNNLKSFLLDMPLELGLKVINRLKDLDWKQKNEILNEKSFVDLFTRVKLKGKK